MHSMQGQVLGSYYIMEPLGWGGMAEVYRAYHPQLDRHAAVKVLRPDLVRDEDFLARFRREARAIAALRHPNIVQVYDLNVQDGVYYMVMELLEGDTLKSRLHDYRMRGEQMPMGEIVRIVLDALDGLGYAHDEGVVHRDIKPSNILLTRRGEVVLADFGIAQIAGETRHTASGALMGTLEYVAPEQGLEGQCDGRSDLYSLGIVFYEMLTDRTPFRADTPLAILLKHLNDPLPRPRVLCPRVPESIEQVVIKSLSKDPQKRYADAAEMAAALGDAIRILGLAVPERVSLPVSFTTPDAPHEPVVVLSGAQRQGLAGAREARDGTTVGMSPVVDQNGLGANAVARDNHREGHPVGRAIVQAVGLLLLGNTAALTVAALTDRWSLFVSGWPVELLLVGLGLCSIMKAASCIWLLIPIGILLGNGLILSYTTLTFRWQQWRFLWPFELWLVLCVVGVTLWLARRSSSPQRTSQWLGKVLGWMAATWSLLVAVAATVA